VGVPATTEEVPITARVQVPATRPPMDKRVKKELFSLVAGAVMFLFFSFYMLLFAKNPDLILPGMFLLVTLFSAFRFLKAKKESEIARNKQEGGEKE